MTGVMAGSLASCQGQQPALGVGHKPLRELGRTHGAADFLRGLQPMIEEKQQKEGVAAQGGSDLFDRLDDKKLFAEPVHRLITDFTQSLFLGAQPTARSNFG